MINFRLRRVDILGEFLVFRTGHTPAERHHFARKRVDREHDTSPEAVTQFMVVRLIAKPRLYEKLFFEAFAHRLLCQSVTPFGAEPQLEFVDNIIAEASLAEVSQSDAASVYVVFQDVLEIVAGEVVDNEHTFVMERAKTHVVHTAFAQRDEIRNHFYDLCGIEYTVYGCLVYHCFISLRMQMYVIFLG